MNLIDVMRELSTDEQCFAFLEKQRWPDSVECPSCGEKHLRQEYSTFAAHAAGPKQADGPVCPSGQCSNPGMCGMNMN